MSDIYDRLLQGIKIKAKETLQNDIKKRSPRKRAKTFLQTIFKGNSLAGSPPGEAVRRNRVGQLS